MTYEERLGWCFKVYDLDDSGYIDREEMTAIIMDINYAIRRWASTLDLRWHFRPRLPSHSACALPRSYKSAKSMITKLNVKYEREFGERLEKVDLAQFKYLAVSAPSGRAL